MKTIFMKTNLLTLVIVSLLLVSSASVAGDNDDKALKRKAALFQNSGQAAIRDPFQIPTSAAKRMGMVGLNQVEPAAGQ